jgi:hypothetical protein
MNHRFFSWRSLFTAIAYLVAVVLVPFLFAGVNYYNKAAIAGQPMEAPAYSDALPAPLTPDPTKKIAVVLSGANGAEITDTLPPFEILARSGAFNSYVVAPERAVLPLARVQ